jgi:hypothetical protein
VPRKRAPPWWKAPFEQWLEETTRALRRSRQSPWAEKLAALGADQVLEPMRRQLMGKRGPRVIASARPQRVPPPALPAKAAITERRLYRQEMKNRKLIDKLPKEQRLRICALGELHKAVARLAVVDFGDTVRIRRQRSRRGALRKKDKVRAIAGRMLAPLVAFYGKPPRRRPIRSFTKALTKAEISLDVIDTLIRHF